MFPVAVGPVLWVGWSLRDPSIPCSVMSRHNQHNISFEGNRGHKSLSLTQDIYQEVILICNINIRIQWICDTVELRAQSHPSCWDSWLHQAVTPFHPVLSFTARGQTISGCFSLIEWPISTHSTVLLGLSNSSLTGLLGRICLSVIITIPLYLTQWSVNSISHSCLTYDWHSIKAVESPFQVGERQGSDLYIGREIDQALILF